MKRGHRPMESEARHQTGGHLTKGFCWRVGWGGGGGNKKRT